MWMLLVVGDAFCLAGGRVCLCCLVLPRSREYFGGDSVIVPSVSAGSVRVNGGAEAWGESRLSLAAVLVVARVAVRVASVIPASASIHYVLHAMCLIFGVMHFVFPDPGVAPCFPCSLLAKFDCLSVPWCPLLRRFLAFVFHELLVCLVTSFGSLFEMTLCGIQVIKLLCVAARRLLIRLLQPCFRDSLLGLGFLADGCFFL